MSENKPSPDMGQSVSNEVTDAACEAFWAYGGGLWVKGRIEDYHLDPDIRKNFLAMRAALEAAERLRAPVGGDGKSNREVLDEEIQKVKFPERHMEEIALAVMARVRCAIPDGWRDIETAPKDGTEILIWGTLGTMIASDNGWHVAAYRRGWWSGKSTISHETHWMPLPAAPALPIAKGAQSDEL